MTNLGIARHRAQMSASGFDGEVVVRFGLTRSTTIILHEHASPSCNVARVCISRSPINAGHKARRITVIVSCVQASKSIPFTSRRAVLADSDTRATFRRANEER
ncbi:hypothetical protein HN011_002851 [Eciton burchellii]|nr:hypothetical protein HN011_002851 [Eciton burchellii]